MTTILIIASIAVAYLFIAGAVGVKFLDRIHGDCGCRKRGLCYEDHVIRACFFGGLFPLSLPIVLGITTSKRGERRREKEIDEANHKLELARIRAKETEYLEKSLEQ